MISELQGMLCGLLQPDPSLRMTLDELLLQSWVSQPISLAEYSWAEVVCAAQNYCKLTNQSVFLTVVVSPSEDFVLLSGSPQVQEPTSQVHSREGLFPVQHNEIHTEGEEEEEDEEDRLSMVALERELQKYLHDDS